MKPKTKLTIVALIAVAVSLIYLAVLLLWSFGILPEYETDQALFSPGYWFFPLPFVGLLSGVLLQVFSVRRAKKNKR